MIQNISTLSVLANFSWFIISPCSRWFQWELPSQAKRWPRLNCKRNEKRCLTHYQECSAYQLLILELYNCIYGRNEECLPKSKLIDWISSRFRAKSIYARLFLPAAGKPAARILVGTTCSFMLAAMFAFRALLFFGIIIAGLQSCNMFHQINKSGVLFCIGFNHRF